MAATALGVARGVVQVQCTRRPADKVYGMGFRMWAPGVSGFPGSLPARV